MRPSDVRIANRKAILKSITECGETTVVALAVAVNLSTRTVQAILRSLRGDGLVVVVTKGIYSLAKKPRSKK